MSDGLHTPHASGVVKAEFFITGRGHILALSEFEGTIAVGDLATIHLNELETRQVRILAIKMADQRSAVTGGMEADICIVIGKALRDVIERLSGASILFYQHPEDGLFLNVRHPR